MDAAKIGRGPSIPLNVQRSLAAQASGTVTESGLPADLYQNQPNGEPLPKSGVPAAKTAQAKPEYQEIEHPQLDPENPNAIAERGKAVADRGDLETLKEYRKDIRSKMKSLGKGAPLKEAAKLHQTLTETQTKLKGLEKEKRSGRWEEIQGEHASPKGKPSATYENFFTTGRVPIKEMKAILKVADELADPNSARRIKGNKIDVLTRGEVWEKKMQLMENAASTPTKDGKPVSLDAEYFELSNPEAIEKMGRAARGGAKVRVLLDSGRLQPDGDNLDATSLCSRLGTIKGLEAGSRGTAAVQLFANQEVLGSRGDLMHRKYLRSGDTVLFGGMNANSGSGENVDSAMTIEGPAAAKQAEAFQADIDRSKGRNVEQIYGTQLQDLREKENITVNAQGLLSLVEAAGTQGPKAGRDKSQRVDAAVESAGFQGIRARDLAVIPDSDGDGKVTEADEKAYLAGGRGAVQLTAKGREFLASNLESAIDRMNKPSNISKLETNQLPDAKVVGTDTVAIGDSSAERTAMMLHAIDTADKKINISAFVVSEEIARALVDKRDRMKAEGKELDVKVVLDPGIYGYGGTPNEAGYRYLEDHKIPVKWAVLDRSDPSHDRKVHAKLMVTDKMMLTGSTNFSTKALKSNWELSDVLYFGDDKDSLAKQQELGNDFDKLWNRESMGINTKDLADKQFATRPPGPERDLLETRYRDKVTRGFLRGIENYEKSIGAKVQDELAENPSLAYNLEQQVKSGKAKGYALWDLMGDKHIQELRESTPAYRTLQEIQQRGVVAQQ